jgi:hypothetical protein
MQDILPHRLALWNARLPSAPHWLVRPMRETALVWVIGITCVISGKMVDHYPH